MGERIWRELSPTQADGLACVVCAADYLTVRSPHVPVGRSESGSQVFACQGACAQRCARDEEMARQATVLSLLDTNFLIGGQPSQGKSAAMRALLLAALEADDTPVVACRDEEQTGGEPR